MLISGSVLRGEGGKLSLPHEFTCPCMSQKPRFSGLRVQGSTQYSWNPTLNHLITYSWGCAPAFWDPVGELVGDLIGAYQDDIAAMFGEPLGVLPLWVRPWRKPSNKNPKLIILLIDLGILP